MEENISNFISACESGNLDVVEEILEIPGFDPNDMGIERFNGLQFACYNGQTRIVSKLLSLPNINLDVRTQFGNTILHWACERNNLDTVKLLLLNPSINIDAYNTSGETPLFITTCWNHIEITKLLIRNGANINKKNNIGTNILVKGCSFETMKFILDIASPKVAFDLMTSANENNQSLLSHILYTFRGRDYGIRVLKYFLIKLTSVTKELGLEINIGDGKHEILEQYKANPEIIWSWQAETDPISDVFTQVVMLCDEYYCFKTCKVLNPAGGVREEKEEEKEDPEVMERERRWFKIVSQLPMELQMLACHRLFYSMKQNVNSKLITAQMRRC